MINPINIIYARSGKSSDDPGFYSTSVLKNILLNRHIIHKQKTFVKISRQERATVFQHELSDMFKNEIPQLLETVFDEIAGENEIIRIDTLQVDLGTLRAENFRNDFKAQLAEQLKKVIRQKKDENIFNNGDIVVIKKEQSQQEAFKHFLQLGTRPWFATVKTLQQWETEILNDFSQQNWQHISAWLKENYVDQPVILKRLINQFSDEIPIRILIELSFFNEREWHIIYNDLTALHSALSLKQGNIRADVWHDIFISFFKDRLRENPLYGPVSTIFQQYYKSTDTATYLKVVNYILAIVFDKKDEDRSLTAEQLSAPEYFDRLKNLEGKINSDVIIDAIKTIDESNQVSEKIKKVDTTALIKTGDNIDTSDEADPDKVDADELTAKDLDKKLKKKKATDAIEGEIQYVINSGIIILHPFLQMYFDGLGMIKEKKFIDVDACKRAVLLLHFLATGETTIAEFDLLLQKIICNLSFEETLPAVLEITDTEKEESEKLLHSVINYWPPLKNTSIAGLRNTFLQREGRLEKKENGWKLTIEQRTVDILLDKLPWGFSTIQLPWMNELLSVDWC